MTMDELNKITDELKSVCAEKIKKYFLEATPEQQTEMCFDLIAYYDEYNTNSETQIELDKILMDYEKDRSSIYTWYWEVGKFE